MLDMNLKWLFISVILFLGACGNSQIEGSPELKQVPRNRTFISDCLPDACAGQFKDFMVRPGGNGDLLPAFGLYPAEGAPALVVDAALAVNAMDIEGLELRPVGGAMLDRAGGTVDLVGRQREV